MEFSRRVTFAVGLFVFLIAAVVYFTTLFPTVPFWDAGEFIACSYILGIPHPPGTPFYILLGRVATMVPWASVAERVNALSALPAAIAVLLTYLTGLKLIRLAQGSSRSRTDEWIAHAGAVVGALLLAFSDAFWENAVEAEVYSLMSLAQILVLWLGLRWWEEHERRPTAGPLLLCVYVMWLCVGLHLGVGIMGLPLILLVWLIDRRAAVVFAMPFLTVVLVTMGLERMAGGLLLLSTITFLIYSMQGKLNPWVAWPSAAVALYGMSIAFGDRAFDLPAAILSLASVLVPLAMLAARTREGRILGLALLLMVAGYSTHAYLPIRAAQHPAINEGSPATWDRLRDLLERKQYGQMNMFERRAPLSVQLDKEFWRYFSRQWPVLPPGTPWQSLLPLALGIAGGVWQMRRERNSFLYTFSFLGLTTAGMIAFLNFSPNEVRERDYFFQSGYHAFTLWIALGAAWLVRWVRESFAAGGMRRYATAGTVVLLACLPLLLLKNLWFTHDRRGNYVARDYAYNMLAPLAPNSFMFTNGDNDTFPLWYIQEVEGFRKDVRIANLSLLNTDWYIEQLRDEEPTVPIQLDDPTVRLLGLGGVREEGTGRFIYTNEYMVAHIMRQNEAGNAWKKQPYFAVTVPDDFGLQKYRTLEGLVYRMNRDTLQVPVNVEATRKALYETFQYRGLFKADGGWDSTVYKDENASTLSRNYASAHVQLAVWHKGRNELDQAIAEMERVERMFPDFGDILAPLGGFYMERGDTAKAMQFFARLVERHPQSADIRYFRAISYTYVGQYDRTLQELDAAIQLDPDFARPYYLAYDVLFQLGQRERALGYLERWVARHPEDMQTREMLDMQRRMFQGSGTAPFMERPPQPTQP